MSSYFSSLVSGKAVPADLAEPSTSSEEGSYFGPPEDSAGLRRSFDLELIIKSNLFDAEFYLSQYPDIAQAGVDPLEHFFDFGYKEGRRPNFYFDPLWYLAQNPDVQEAGVHPLVHYASYGDIEGRKPGLTFDPAWYRQKYGLDENIVALSDYLSNRQGCRCSPIPDFDVEHYARSYPDVVAAGIDPFEHFVSYGYREGRTPSAEFDSRFYSNRYLKNDTEQNPFLHFLAHKHMPGVYGRMPENETSIPREVKRFTKKAPEFEEISPLPASAPRRAKVLTYYLPQFHAFEENDAWWGRGFTEWTNIARGIPRFAGHYQPRIPRDLGFYSLDNIETIRRQVEMAKAGGVYGFVFYYYWFNGKRLLDRPLEMFLQDQSIEMPFCLMWANENWTRRWDGADAEILMSQDYRPDDEADLVEHFARHFADPRYIRLQGRPLLMIYRPGLIPDAKDTLERLREDFRTRFNVDPLLVMGQTFNATDPTAFGMDGAIEFPPHKLTQDMIPVNQSLHYLDIEFEGKAYRYDDVMKVSLDEPKASFPLIKTAVPSWDNDARRQGNGLVLIESTPQKYQMWLTELVNRAVASPFFGEPIVCVNAWNEWCEAAYLEPDLHFGAAYLNATGRAVSGRSMVSFGGKLLLVGHDCFPSGAQHLLLNIRRTLHSCFGAETSVLLLDGGKLEDAYRELGPIYIGGSPAVLEAYLQSLREQGFTAAIVNTSAAASAVPTLKKAGFSVTFLVHELPRILKEKFLLEKARVAGQLADHIVFPANGVRDRVSAALNLGRREGVAIIPQGLYREINLSEDLGARVRDEFGVGIKDRLVVAVGYADLRKGFDLFLQVWRFVRSSSRITIHFCWIGGHDPDLKEFMRQEVTEAQETGTFHIAGYRDDVSSFFSGADAFVLTSREDPFPSVVLESLYAGLPTVAFEGSGGIPELLKDHPLGHVVPFADTVAMANTLMTATKNSRNKAEREAGRELIEQQFNFSDYVWRLLSTSLSVPAISVAVPNYNYASHIPGRLGSIFAQTQPVREILVLDDCSTDNSLEVIRTVAQEWRRKIRVLPNIKNSGSVFKQWRKAAEESIGEFLWIAEADDLSDPRFLGEVVDLMSQDESIVFGFSDSSAIDKDGAIIWPSYTGYYSTVAPNALAKTETFDASLFAAKYLSVKNLILNVSSVVWRRQTLLDAMDACGSDLGTFKMAGDWKLYLQALSVARARVAYCSNPYNIHRRHAASVTHTLDADRHVAEIAACHKFAREVFTLKAETRKSQDKYLTEVIGQFVAAKTSDGGEEAKKSASRGAGGVRRNSNTQPSST